MPDELKPGPSSLEALTEKQRAVLDLLLQHMTSKEIARKLDISPHTVDQRIAFAKEKLGVSNRGELAVEYLRQLSVYEQLTYEESHIVVAAIPLDKSSGSNEERALVHNDPDRIETDGTPPPPSEYRVVPEMFEGRLGTLFRIGAIALIAFVMILLVLGGLVIFSETSEIFAD